MPFPPLPLSNHGRVLSLQCPSRRVGTRSNSTPRRYADSTGNTADKVCCDCGGGVWGSTVTTPAPVAGPPSSPTPPAEIYCPDTIAEQFEGGKAGKRVKNNQMEGKSLGSFTNIAFSECAQRCINMNSQCRSFHYRADRGNCEIFSAFFSDSQVKSNSAWECVLVSF